MTFLRVARAVAVVAIGVLITVALIAVSRLAAGDSPLERLSADGVPAKLTARDSARSNRTAARKRR